jgi:hypothetical protein
MGGELQVYRGEAEPISNNPYLPDGGETVMFRGPSHENGGMPISYGQSPVEVEGGEPAVKLRDGGSGEDNMVVFGNLIESESKRKFKNIVADIAKNETKQNKIIDKSTNQLNNLDVNTSFDKLKLSSLQANLMGGNMKLKNYAQEKMDLAAKQSAINDTAEEYGLIADDLAQGKMKKVKMGTSMKKAQVGINTSSYNSMPPYSYNDTLRNIMGQDVYRKSPYMPGFGVESGIEEVVVRPELETSVKMPDIKTSKKEEIKKEKFPWMNIVNQALPFLRPSDVEDLDPRQLSGEFYALSNNQVEPVQAQTFQPLLQTSYDISLQDQLNEITAQTKQAERLVGNNSEALAAIYAQATMAKNKVIGEQMRINQGLDADVYRSNINALNQAQLQNLQMYDTQQQRQEAAKSATKATTQEALNSVASKYAQNKAANRQLAIMENMYNFRYDKSGRAINMNPLAKFDTEVTGGSANSAAAPAGYEFETILKKKKAVSTKESRNGSIVKAIKNL